MEPEEGEACTAPTTVDDCQAVALSQGLGLGLESYSTLASLTFVQDTADGVKYKVVSRGGKVLKHPERANWGKQFAYSMHRESQWSLQQLHQEGHPQYDAKAARLFARYLEDHTGYDRIGPSEFEAKRRL